MSRILVVDDSPLDQQIIGGLMEKHGNEELLYAEDGETALRAVEEYNPDLVLTDLQMPGMNGLELVAELKQRHPHIPVILMTSSENEDVAVQALKAGAATYVPKRRLSQDLWETVFNVLGVSREQQRHARAMMRLNRWEADFTVESDMDLIMTISGYLMQNFAAMDLCESSEQVRVGVAVAEALQNAYFHGSLQMPRALKEASREEYAKLAETRAKESPYKDRKIQITARFSRGHAIFCIRDEGDGFDVSRMSRPFDAPSYSRSAFFWSGFNDSKFAGALDQRASESSQGRGLMLMRTLMDEVKFNEQGNQVTLIKKSTKAAPAFSKPNLPASKPAVISSKPAPVAAPEPVVTKQEVVQARPEPFVQRPEPVVAHRPEPIIQNSEPIVAQSPEPVVSRRESVGSKSTPMISRLEVDDDTIEPVAKKPQLQLTAKPIVSRPLQPTSRPIQITAKPVQPPAKPIPSLTSKPVQEVPEVTQTSSSETYELAQDESTPAPESPSPEQDAASDQQVLSIKSRKVMAH